VSNAARARAPPIARNASAPTPTPTAKTRAARGPRPAARASPPGLFDGSDAAPDAARDSSAEDSGTDAGPDAGPDASAGGDDALDCTAPPPGGDTDTRTCVQCTAETNCGGDTPACDTPTHTCVACTKHSDCGALKCNADHECVDCLSDTHCPAPDASRCTSAQACAPCSTNAHCAHIAGKGVCDGGECVECTGTDYAACGTMDATPLVCDSLARECTDRKEGSATPCAACLSDAQCVAGTLCVPMTFGAGNAAVGSFCLWRRDASGGSAPSGDCLNVRPYIAAESGWTSLDGASDVVCKPARTTCQGQIDILNKACSGADTAGHAL
jgi:hypothetical protein